MQTHEPTENTKAMFFEANNPVIALPLYLYDHSGITMSTSPFSCRWDSGQVGFIYVTCERVRKEYGWKRITKARRDKILTYLNGEVQTYDQYLTGDVYGFIISDEDGDEVDSCWGCYGRDYCEQEAQATIRHLSESK